MQKANNYLTAKYLNGEQADGTIALTSLRNGLCFYLLGASCPTSVLAGCDKLQSLVITPRIDSERDLVAVAIFWPNNRQGIEYGEYLLCVTRGEGEQVWIDLETPFRPSSDRMGQLVGEGQAAFFVADVKGRKIVYQPYALLLENRLKLLTNQGYAVVGAGGGNLLCRYLLNEATPEEVEAAIIASPDASSELERLRKEVARLSQLPKEPAKENALLNRYESSLQRMAEVFNGADVQKRTWLNQRPRAKYWRLRKLFFETLLEHSK